MPVSFDRFVRVLTGQVSEKLYNVRRDKARAAMQAVASTIKELSPEVKGQVETQLNKLVMSFNAAEKLAKRDRKQACAELETVKIGAVNLKKQCEVLPRQIATAVDPGVDPQNAEPVAPEPVAPEPVAPEPVAPEPVAPELVAPEPVAPEPVAPEPVASSPEDREAFETAWASVRGDVEKLQRELTSGLFDQSPRETEEDVVAFKERMRIFDNAKAAENYLLAKQQLEVIEEYVAGLNEQCDQAKVAFDACWDSHFVPVMNNINANLYGTPVIKHFQDYVRLYEETTSNIEEAKAAGNYFKANSLTTNIVSRKVGGASVLQTAIREFNQTRKETIARYQSVSAGIAAGTYDFEGSDQLKQRFSDTLSTAIDQQKSKIFREVQTALDALELAGNQLKNASFAQFSDQVAASEKTGKLVKFVKSDPDYLKSIFAQQNGAELLDECMASLGSKAHNEDHLQFAISATEARYGVNLTGDNGGTYVCKLYSALKILPESHTTLNESLNKINREKPGLRELISAASGELTSLASDYDSQEAGGTINLRLRSEGVVDTLGAAYARVIGDVFSFDHVTLHEVGHAVDEAKQFMKNNGAKLEFGGWQEETVEGIAEKVGNAKGFFNEFNDVAKNDLLKFLQEMLKNNANYKIEGLPAEISNAMANHAAAKHCRGIVLKGGHGGLWDRKPDDFAINGRIYQQAYDSKWVSYLQAARVTKLTNYQFRAPGEWYSEVYALFFSDRLKSNHPLYAILGADKRAG